MNAKLPIHSRPTSAEKPLWTTHLIRPRVPHCQPFIEYPKCGIWHPWYFFRL